MYHDKMWSVTQIWISVLTFCSIAGLDMQPCPCTLDAGTLSVDCSGLKLKSISEIVWCVPKSVKYLSLSSNEISVVPPNSFKAFAFLRSLRLDHNKLEYLQNDSFKGLSKLKSLSLSQNKLKYNRSIGNGVFKPLANLRNLELQGNCDVFTSVCLYPEKALSVASSLKHLRIDGIPNADFGAGFAELKNLYSLYLSNENGYCHMPVLTESTFKVFKHSRVSHLQLESCEITRLEPNVFRSLPNLTNLTITGNRKLCSDSIENATVGLDETNIQTIIFNFWCRKPPFYPILAENNFKSLSNTSLKVLDLGWNYIYYVDPTAIENLPKSLEYLSLKQNSIGHAEFLKQLERLDNLKTFDASFQNYFQADVTNVDEAKRRPSSGKNSRKIVYTAKLHRTKSSKINFNENDSRLHLPINLERLYMNNIKLGYPVPSVTFAPNKLRYLNASSCMLSAFLGPWYGILDLQVLDISHNEFSFFNHKSLIDMKNLTHPYLQHSEIGKSLSQDINDVTFSSLHNLVELDLSNCIIKDLPYNIFQHQVNLRNLSLADNSLKNISFMLKSMTKLRHLDLSGNELEYISKENMDALDKMAAYRTICIDLSGNKLGCMCDAQDFVNWLAATHVNIIKKDQLYCLYINRTLVSLAQIEDIQELLKYECSSWMLVTSCIIIFIGLLLVLSLFALIYYKRWQLRYLWYIGRIKIDPFHHPNDREEVLLKIDAYISYEQHYDVTSEVSLHQVITDKVYPFFEERGYNLNIREEFQGNEKLYHVIPKAVRKSRKVIVILTPSYCDDYSNTFEFNIAAYEGIYTQRNVVIPVLLGNVIEQHWTPEILSFIRSKIRLNEVLFFPSRLNDIDTFIEKLEFLIKR